MTLPRACFRFIQRAGCITMAILTRTSVRAMQAIAEDWSPTLAMITEADSDAPAKTPK